MMSDFRLISMKVLLYAISIGTVVSSLSCSELPATRRDPREVSLLPGECLISTNLQHHYFESDAQVFDVPILINRIYNASNVLEPEGMSIAFDLDMDIETETISTIRLDGPAMEYRWKPTKTVYSSFKENSVKAEEAFDAYYSLFINDPDITGLFTYPSTIYYCGGMSLRASVPFCGIPEGENLDSVAYIHYDPLANIQLPSITIPADYISLGKTILIRIPIQDYELVDKEVSFHLEVPVRVGLLLKYLLDKELDPDVQMQFKEVVLTCDFTINKSLQ